MVDKQLNDSLPSEQFSTKFGVCCNVTRPILKPTDVNNTDCRQKSY